MKSLKSEALVSNHSPVRANRHAGFSLLELMVAMVVTLVITGSMYGLIAAGQGAFRREPLLVDRQQQIRIAMTRIQEDAMSAGLGLGAYFQSFAPSLGAVGVAGASGAAATGVRPASDTALGGGRPDALEIRSQSGDCPQVRGSQVGASVVFDVIGGTYPPCYAPPSFVLAIYPSGAAKFALITHDPAGTKLQFAPGLNTVASGSQFATPNNIRCDLYLAAASTKCPGEPGGPPAPTPPALPNVGAPSLFSKMELIAYRIGLDTDLTPSLFRSSTGGYDNVAGTFNTLPPGPAWQLVARGIEDMQIRYRTATGWQQAAPAIAAPSFDNVVREIEITLWARAVGGGRQQGETLAAGNLVTAVRGQLITTVAPRAAQIALMGETDAAKRWQ